MKVAYIFESSNALFILDSMILPQLEKGNHGAEVAGMFFMFDNTFLVEAGNSVGKRINELAEKTGMLVMACDQCCYQRSLEGRLIPKAGMGCFPNLYAALGKVGVDQVITL
jgi:hypothetical protein